MRRLYLVCGASRTRFLHAALRGGVDIVQLRIKHGRTTRSSTAARALAERLRRARRAVHPQRPTGPGQAAGADGVHVGQDDMPVAAARTPVGPDRLVGLSTHTPRADRREPTAGVDYIGVGPVHETPTKPGRPAVGLELVRYAAARARVPFFAIGGIDPANVEQVVAAGRGAGRGRARADRGARPRNAAARTLSRSSRRGLRGQRSRKRGRRGSRGRRAASTSRRSPASLARAAASAAPRSATPPSARRSSRWRPASDRGR